MRLWHLQMQLQELEGYGVHAAKIARCGVPFYLSHTIVRVEGGDAVHGSCYRTGRT